jgi:hypothetical protein
MQNEINLGNHRGSAPLASYFGALDSLFPAPKGQVTRGHVSEDFED